VDPIAVAIPVITAVLIVGAVAVFVWIVIHRSR
jgi:hypothetical protein